MLSVDEVRKLSVEELRSRYGGESGASAAGPPLRVDGINHVAWVSSDMAKTLWFWSEGLGLRLTKTIALPDQGQHFFLDGGNGAALAYFWFPNAPKAEPGVASIDVMKAVQTGDFSTAHGSVNHAAWNVDSNKLREYRKRIQKLEVGFVSPILYHGDTNESGYDEKKGPDTTWESFYFTGPDGEYLELTSQTTRPFTAERDILHVPAGPVSHSKL